MPLKTATSMKPRFSAVAAAAFLSALAVLPVEAGAVSAKVKFACAHDYYAYCSKYSPNSPEVRECMDAAGEKLSSRCVNALVADGEVSGKEVSQRAATLKED